MAILEIADLVKNFALPGSREVVKAVSGVSFAVYEGETLGIVGESGSGKTTVGRMILRLIEPTGGSIRFQDRDLVGMDPKALRELRSDFQMIFQDPGSSLNPRMSVQKILERPLQIHRKDLNRSQRIELMDSTLVEVGLAPEHKTRFPHEFSGGQRQRISIARALIIQPDLMVLDEPTSALDVSVQAQILNLLRRLQRDYSLTYVFISHDLSVVRYMSTKIAVMYLGRIVEVTTRERIFTHSMHPYTIALTSAIPIPDPVKRRHPKFLKGEIPSSMNPPPGCHLHPRCDWAEEICSSVAPALEAVADNHYVACHFVEKGEGEVH